MPRTFKREGAGMRGRAVAVLLVVVAGCSSGSDRVPVFPVRGQVFYQSKPAVGAVVILNPQDASLEGKLPMNPNGKVEADGSFRITTYAANDGAPAGEYKVTILWPPRESGDSGEDAGGDRFNGRYANPATSRITASVQAGDNSLPRYDLK